MSTTVDSQVQAVTVSTDSIQESVQQQETEFAKQPPIALVEDTEEDSDDDNDDGNSSLGDDEDDERAQEHEDTRSSMPLLKYTRLFGSLPREPRLPSSPSPPLSTICTCSVMGKVLLTPENTAVAEPVSASSNTNNNNNNHAADSRPEPVSMDLWQQPIHVTATGYQDGQVLLVDALTGVSIATPGQLRVREHNTQPIVAVSMDSSGTYLAAMDAAGMGVIWEIKYTIQLRSPVVTTSANAQSTTAATTTTTAAAAATTEQQPQGNVFTSFMSAWTGGGSASAGGGGDGGDGDATRSEPPQEPVLHVPILTLASVQVSRITYPKSYGVPTCMVLDPAYKKRREKALMVGFNDGRLVLTKRGFVFQRRSDAVVYQAVAADDKNFVGIEALVWRGSLVAWADCSGVRLLDADTLTRIAHVDRPKGARPSLYPTVASLRPNLCFETSSKLLVAWGDCLMRLAIRETSTLRQSTVVGASTGSSSSEVAAAVSGANGTAVIRKRTVECTMAWELDCVACGVAPLDEEHVVVLGLVPPLDVVDGEQHVQTGDEDHQNDVELQVVSRSDGTVVYSDLLPLLRPLKEPKRKPKGSCEVESVANYALLSSFALPRMENAHELREDSSDEVDDNFDPLQVSIFSAPETKRTFRDSHFRWNLKQASYEDADLDDSRGEGTQADLVSDADSVDSDNYSFILRHPPTETEENSAKRSVPPAMLISTGVDVVLATIRNVDDAVSYALSSKRAGLSLQRALRHRRRLRRYDINDLVNEYFRAVLRLPEDEGENDQPEGGKGTGNQEERPHLSLRRMKLAAEAMPILLGGNNILWQRWVSELEKIPGALFVVRSFLPVRDPVLPKVLYARVLEKMLLQVDEMKAASHSDAVERLAFEAEGHFLNTLIAWGSTENLREHIKLYEYQSEHDESFLPTLHAVEESLRRRSAQTAAGYLRFPSPESSEQSHPVVSQCIEDAQSRSLNGLYNVDDLIPVISQRVDSHAIRSALPANEPAQSGAELLNSRVALDALAKLNMMKGQYEDALRCFLTIGALHSSDSLDAVEDAAIRLVNSDDTEKDPSARSKVPYAYVLAFIETHHLYQCILTPNFLSDDASTSPLFALLRLVGLDVMGDFLLQNCVSPEQQSMASTGSRTQSKSSDKTGDERRGTLPLDLVVKQLEASPKLLHWYLHTVFVLKPEIYVKFPNTANPPAIITSLHRRHLELYIKYAGRNRNSVKVLEGVEAYRVGETTTPLLSFLTIVLQLGGIRPTEVGKTLEVERKGGAGVSRTFALELAHIMEHFGETSEAEAWLILELYLKGAMSLMLAVAYAQRVRQHSSALWKILINHCLSANLKQSKTGPSADGSLFGSLLEAAALSGADLAHLVAQIPPGMAIEGLRPRLVAAVADYRLKLVMHKSSSEIAAEDKIVLLRERTHRARRGMRCEILEVFPREKDDGADAVTVLPMEEETLQNRLTSLRTKERNDRYSLAYSLPMR